VPLFETNIFIRFPKTKFYPYFLIIICVIINTLQHDDFYNWAYLLQILIREYRLPYNKIFHKGKLEGIEDVKLFSYLDKNNISGRTLFNDIQGLKYDLKFFHNS